MYSKQLEEIIDAALADGEITEKERAVLHKKASLEGIDPDELDVVIEGRLAKTKKEKDWLRPAPPQNLENEKRGNVVKCPHCGAPIEAGAVKCKECGYVFTNVKANSSSERFAKELKELEAKTKSRGLFSEQLSKNKQKVLGSFIQNFPVPSGKEDLLEFISSMDARRRNTGMAGENYILADAYNAKYKECVLKAKTLFPDDTQVQTAISLTDKLYLSYGKKLFIGYLIFLLLIVGGVAILWGSIEDKKDTKVESVSVADEFHTPEFITKTVSEWTQKAPFTASFAKTIDDVDDAALKKGSEIGWWDYDVWLESQDPDDNGTIEDVEVLNVSGNEADVKLNVVQYGSKSPRQLKLAFDGDKWLVADFQNSEGKWITDLCKEALKKIEKW